MDPQQEDDDKKPTVLEPDHPLMRKFQTTLKKFLEEENERILTEILELGGNLRRDKDNYEKLMSHDMYNLELEISQQRKQVIEYEEKLKSAEEFRVKKNLAVKESREKYKATLEQLNQEKNRDTQLINELEALTLLCKQYENWEDDVNSELAVNQRISEKSGQEKQLIMEEKKKADAMLYKLTTDIWDLQSKISLMEDQMKIKSQELKHMREHVASSTADLQSLHLEQQQLMLLWNSAVVNIQQKDKILADINDEYGLAQDNFKTVIADIEAIKKEIRSEKKKNEYLMMIKNRDQYDISVCSQMMKVENGKQKKIEDNYINISSALEATERDLQSEKTENFMKDSNLKTMTIQYEMLLNKKVSLENEILSKLQERLSSDKNVDDLAGKIRKLKETTREEELNMLKIENRYASTMLKIEKQKISNSKTKEILNDKRIDCDRRQRELTDAENKLKSLLCDIEKKQKQLELINKKIEIALEKSKGVEMSPIEIKIEQLDSDINKNITAAKDLRQNWIRLQKYVISSTEQHQKLIEEIDLIQNKTHLLEHKLYKLKNSITQQEKEKKSVQQLIDREIFRKEQLARKQHQNKCNNSNLEAKYNDLTVEYMAKLKDAEMKAMMIREDIENLENEKEQVAMQLENLQKDIKHWQKLEMIALESRDQVKEEKNVTGEISKMKTEIHRMQVRQSQVVRTAERLATDLAQTVWRRKAAIIKAKGYSKKKSTPRYAFSMKIKEKRSEIRGLNQDVEDNQKLIEKLNNEKKIIMNDILDKEIIMSALEDDIAKFRQQHEECSLFKQKNLEKIVRNQRSAQHYALVVDGRIQVHNAKFEPIISAKYNKQAKFNLKLINLVKCLYDELPENQIALTRILNTLKVDSNE